MQKKDLVALGARIPSGLKKSVMAYCDSHGIKLRFFVAQALAEKLLEEQETVGDNATVDARLKGAQYVGAGDLAKYAASRKKRA
jgi:hypothetical protein